MPPSSFDVRIKLKGMKRIVTLILFLRISLCLSVSYAAILSHSLVDTIKTKQEKYASLEPFNKTSKRSLLIGAVLMPIGLVISESSSKQAGIGAPFAEIGGGVLGFLGLLLIAFGLLFWFGRWLVRRHYRLPPRKRRWQWLVYLGSLIALTFLGFALILGF